MLFSPCGDAVVSSSSEGRPSLIADELTSVLAVHGQRAFALDTVIALVLGVILASGGLLGATAARGNGGRTPPEPKAKMIPNASYVDRIVGVPSQPICPSSPPTSIDLTINPKAPGLDLPPAHQRATFAGRS